MFGSAEIVTNLPATDLDRARRFYQDTLGLKPLVAPAPDMIAFEAGNGTKLMLYQRGPTKADHTALTFLVKDVGAAVDALNRKGVQMQQYDMPGIQTDARGIVAQGDDQIAWFLDTEGNILSVATAPKT